MEDLQKPQSNNFLGGHLSEQGCNDSSCMEKEEGDFELYLGILFSSQGWYPSFFKGFLLKQQDNKEEKI